MPRYLRLILLPALLLSLIVANYHPAGAARGTPSSQEFGFGAILYPQGPYIQTALKMASDLDLDWIEVPVSWSAVQSDRTASPRSDTLDAIMQYAGAHKIAVLVSISSAPVWAQTTHGPDPDLSAQFVAALYQRYTGSLQAVELFPRANTQVGWGSQPDPAAYNTLFRRVADRLHQMNAPVLLVAAGLEPQAHPPAQGNMDDLVFLEQLYQLGAANVMPVISIHYTDMAEDTLIYPENGEHRVLRHYEEVRKIMAENQHKNGLIWITHLSLPSGTINTSDSAIQDVNAQADWIGQIYIQTRGQLYIGVTMAQSLNPGPEVSATAGVPSLFVGEGVYHPFYAVLDDMISLNKSGSVIFKPGKPKEGYFIKNRP